MTFLNKKEEVIDLILTTKGREKYSKGKLNPVYYEFYDDEIIYDNKHAATGSVEYQNETVPRIRKTLIPKNQSSWQGALYSQKKFDISKEPFFYEMGKSNPFLQYKPAWDATLIKGNLTGAINFIPLEKNLSSSAEYHGERIPQLNAYCMYDVYNILDPKIKTPTAIYYDRSSDDFLFSIVEKNELDETENFELEVFQYIYDPQGNVKDLQKLYFDGKEYTEEYVEFFFNVAFDVEESLNINYIKEIGDTTGLVKGVEGECE
jgi:hypothetical protein